MAWIIFISTIFVMVMTGLLAFFLCRFARIYRTNPSGERELMGYLWKRSNSYVVYDGIPLLGADRIGYLDQQKRVYLKTENNQHNYVDIEYGIVDDQGAVSDTNNTLVATCDCIGQDSNSTSVIDSFGNEVAYVSTGFKKGDDLLVRAAAVGALFALHDEDSSALRADVRVGFKDMALPATLIFTLIFVPLAYLFFDNNTANIEAVFIDPYLYVCYMLLAYGVICWVLYFIKKCMTMRNRSLVHIVELIDCNVGVKAFNILIVVTSIVLLLVTIFGDNYTLMPLFLVIAIGFLTNMSCFNKEWHIAAPCSTWGTKWGYNQKKTQQMPQGQQQTQGRKHKTYSWAPILQALGINHNNEEVVVTFTESDFEPGQGRVRTINPFAGNKGLYADELKLYASKVLAGCDDAAKEESNAIVAIINSAYQLCQKYNIADYELYELILRFCQHNIEYILDEECESIGKAVEYFRFAAETLYDGQGDCDCKSVLLYRIFKTLGVNAELALVKFNEKDDYSHVGVVVHRDNTAIVPMSKTYHEYASGLIYCETTGLGYAIGDVPKGADVKSIYLLQ